MGGEPARSGQQDLLHTPRAALSMRIRYFHFIWHLFVIAGTACHFIAVLRYAA